MDTREMSRDKVIVRASIVGVAANILLAAFKAFVGLAAKSLAVTLDAVNNLSDALSSVVTIVGTKLALKRPDKKHPYGYGRIEYLSAMIIAVVVLYAGLTSLVESVKKIIRPELADYSPVSLVIIAAAVLVKIVLGIYVSRTGRRVASDALVDSGKDALFDSVLSAATLVAAVVFMVWKVSVEQYLGAVISLFIIKSGIEMLKETVSRILGERIDSSLAKSIKETVRSFDGVQGAYDLTLNNYGPDLLMGSVHIEVPDSWTATEIDSVTRKIQETVLEKHNVMLSAVGVYSINSHDGRAMEIRSLVHETLKTFPQVLQFHGFYYNAEKNSVSFDIIVDFSCKDMDALHRSVVAELEKKLPGISLTINLDADISD